MYNSFNQQLTDSDIHEVSGIQILNFTVLKIRLKVTEINVDFQFDKSPHIVCFTETWASEEKTKLLKIDQCSIYCRN